MNIIDVMKTGKPFKRSSWECDFWEPSSEVCGYRCFQFTVGDLIADDWIIKQEPITKQEFWEIYRDWLVELETRKQSWGMHQDSDLNKLIGKLADRLGFR